MLQPNLFELPERRPMVKLARRVQTAVEAVAAYLDMREAYPDKPIISRPIIWRGQIVGYRVMVVTHVPEQTEFDADAIRPVRMNGTEG